MPAPLLYSVHACLWLSSLQGVPLLSLIAAVLLGQLQAALTTADV